MRSFCFKVKKQDWSKYFDGVPPQSRKQKLLDECAHHDVSVHIDDALENSTGIYAQLRAVASEAELDRRLNAKLAIKQSSRANLIAGGALLVSFIALVVSLWSNCHAL